MTNDIAQFTDADLVAYLDGELDGETVARIDAARASDAELDARLAAMDFPKGALAAALSPEKLDAPAAPIHVLAPPAPKRNRVLIPMALAASFLAGVAVTSGLSDPPLPPAKPGWVDTVASYQALYVEETLAGARQEAALTDAVLARAEGEFGIDLDATLAIDGLTFKRAQILGYEDGMLLQLAYVDAEGRPFAFCITRVKGDDRDRKLKMSHDIATASWVRNGLGFVLLGGDDRDAVEALSSGLRTL